MNEVCSDVEQSKNYLTMEDPLKKEKKGVNTCHSSESNALVFVDLRLGFERLRSDRNRGREYLQETCADRNAEH